MSSNQSGKNIDQSRRKSLKYGIAAIVAAAVAGGGGYAAWQATRPKPTPSPSPTVSPTSTPSPTATPSPTPSPTPTPAEKMKLRHGTFFGVIGLPLFQDVIDEEANVTVEYIDVPGPTYLSTFTTRINEFDIIFEAGNYHKPLMRADPPTFLPVPVEKIPRWTEDNICRNLYDIDDWQKDLEFGYQIAPEIKKDMWWDWEGEAFSQVPFMTGLDQIGYNPELIDVTGGTEGEPDITSFGDIIDPQWKGNSALSEDMGKVLPEWYNYLAKHDMADPPENICNLSREEIEIVVDFLIPVKKSGQFKVIWSDFGTIVDAVVGREVWLGDFWVAITNEARRKGVPNTYLNTDEGGAYWFASTAVSRDVTDPEKFDRCCKVANAWLHGVQAMRWAHMGFQAPQYYSQETIDAMGSEFYAWNHLGEKTYKPITETIWGESGYPDRVAKCLFLSDQYEWSMEAGTSHPNGHKRYSGHLDNEYWKSIGIYITWQTEGAYYAEQWARFKAA